MQAVISGLCFSSKFLILFQNNQTSSNSNKKIPYTAPGGSSSALPREKAISSPSGLTTGLPALSPGVSDILRARFVSIRYNMTFDTIWSLSRPPRRKQKGKQIFRLTALTTLASRNIGYLAQVSSSKSQWRSCRRDHFDRGQFR